MVTIVVREDMLVLAEMHDPAGLPESIWQEVAPARKRNRDPPPQRGITRSRDLSGE